MPSSRTFQFNGVRLVIHSQVLVIVSLQWTLVSVVVIVIVFAFSLTSVFLIQLQAAFLIRT